jgi:iron complex transport system substrate-binding protein
MENAVTAIMDYPQLSLEGILRLQPDIVIDLSMRRAGQLPERIADDWQSLPAIPAVKNGMVFCFSAEYMTIPGPRVFLILKDLKRILSIYRNSPRK